MVATIYDVAREAGVSISTVSKALNDSYTIPEQTKQMIREVAQRLEYRPNARAKNFARQSTGTVIFATDLYKNVAFENPHLFEIVCGVTTQLSRKAYALLLKPVTKQLAPEYLRQVIQERTADGLLIHANILSDELSALLAKTDFPYLVIGKPEARASICWMDVNHEQAGELAANYLLDRGYRRMVFLAGTSDPLTQSRMKGIEQAMAEEGLSARQLLCDSDYSIDERKLAELFGGETPPEVVICSNNHLALHCVQYLRRSGKKIPQEAAILTFDNYPFSMITEPKLSAVDVDMQDLGVNAAQFILRRIKKPNLRTQSYCTSPILLEREST